MSFTEAWYIGPQATNFYTRKYAADSPKAALVFVHGFIEHIARYDAAHSRLSARGITVFAFDLRGFGKTAQDPEKKSTTSSYGKTSWKDQMADINWAIEFVQKDVPGVPVFLWGQSMGGGQVLGFATEPGNNSTVQSLSGVIASSPLLELTNPASKIARFFGGYLARILPYVSIPAEVKPNDLSRDPSIGEAYMKDPLVKHNGTLRGVGDMLSKGEELVNKRYKDFPKTLPVLLIHGSSDKVTSHKATQAFHDKLTVENKKIIVHEGAYHELTNEPDGLSEKVVDQAAEFMESLLPSKSAVAPPSEPATKDEPLTSHL